MDNINENMTTEEVIEVTKEITVDSENDFKMAVGIGLVLLVGGITYKYIAKPLMAKIKAKNNHTEIDTDTTDTSEVDEIVEEIDED